MINRFVLLLGLGLFATVALAEPSAEPLLKGDAEAGANKAAPCAACHGADGNSQNPQWPKLAGQGAPYMYEQLKLFKSGTRKNAIMQGQVANLSDQDMQDLAAFYATQQIKPGVADENQVEAGARLYRAGNPDENVPACSGCHGPAGLGNIAAKYPRLSGQHSAYVASQLEAYRAGERDNYRLGKIMGGVSAGLSDEDIQALAAYVSGLKPRSNP